MTALPAFRVYRNRFPWDSPVELAVIRASDAKIAAKAAKQRWPGVPLVIATMPKPRSPSSTAYRAFLAEKRAMRSVA